MTQSSAAQDNLAYNYCAVPLARYACRPDQSRGRIYEESESRHRTCFQRDRDRIIHCSAFRRLKYKTQVFVYYEGDDYRTRLSHTIEVAQIARTLARALLVNEDLAEAIALAHDLGHTPFAHAGEETLKKCMENLGGFEHNDQSLRVLTMQENKYPEWRGLNLTWETLEGVAKHNGPVIPKNCGNDVHLPTTLRQVQNMVDLEIDGFASIEAQIAAIADDIAYNNHDVEDGLKANIFSLEQICAAVPLFKERVDIVRRKYPNITQKILISESIRDMIGVMVDDVLAESLKNIAELKPQHVDDVRNHSKPIIRFSDDMFQELKILRAFLMKNMYRHHTIQRIWIKAEKIIGDLFDVYMNDQLLLTTDIQEQIEKLDSDPNNHKKARIIADHIASMTDRSAAAEHEAIFNLYKRI
ncbi:MAG: deoxyguanosinetriphosphate triphosphohydrolase [Alphaproteobacteria bacterium]|nr:deoxyguanosinetriphosphate triphosphohydrolase [Alphaproteobacteria bacterium]